MSNLTGKVAFVTGASKGIGASIARHLAAAGAQVIVNYASSKEGADKVVAEICAGGGKANAVQGDFSQAEDISRCFTETARLHDNLDILINNAAVWKFNSLEDVTVEEFHRHFNLNVLGLLLATQAAVKLMGGSGSVVNIGSVIGVMSPARSSVYAGSKGAVEAITTALSKELGPRGIRVNSLIPGAVQTEGASVRAGTAEAFRAFVERTPLGRVGFPEDIAKIAVFLSSDDAAWLTGQHIIAAGGLTM